MKKGERRDNVFHFIKSLEKEVYAAAMLVLVIIGLTTEGFGGAGRNTMTAMAETPGASQEEKGGDGSDSQEERDGNDLDSQEEERDGSGSQERIGEEPDKADEEAYHGTEKEDLKESQGEEFDGADRDGSPESRQEGFDGADGEISDGEDTVEIEYGRQVVGYLLEKDRKRQSEGEGKEASSSGEPETEAAGEHSMNQQDYQVLLRIVEAEAGVCDDKGKILVANVILNRVKSDEFPDSVTDVVYQPSQFSPVSNGSINTCKVSSETVESVNRALQGEDYSQGALFFMNRTAARSGAVRWFDGRLTYLFAYQGHEFFK